MHSLKTKITLLSVWMTVIAVAVATLMSVLFIRNAEIQESEQLLLVLCETGERNLNYYFNSVEQSVKKVYSFTERELDGLEEDKLRAHVERVKGYFDQIANKTNGVLTYYYRIDPAVSETVKGFWFINLYGTGFEEHAVTDITLYDTEDTSKLVWFTVPKATGNPVWLTPYQTDNLDVRVISYNIPIYWRGKFVGVIGIELDHSTMAEQVESIRLYNNGYAFLTDANGSLIFHPRFDISRMTEAEKPAVPEGLLSESSYTKYTFEGIRKEAMWLRLTNGMRLYVSVPEKETEGDWERLIGNMLAASAAVLLLSALLTWLVTRRVTKPLVQLTEAAKKADEGNYDFALDYQGKDEVGTLTKTFKRMAEHMKAHISDLNKRAFVDALTSVRNKGAFTAFMEEMQEKLDKEGAAGQEFGIAVFDCDDLKAMNDQYGHDKGDLYLKAASRMICRIFQHSPVFRIGGDEFAVILRNDDFRNREALMNAFEGAMVESVRSAANRWDEVHVAMGLAVYDARQDHTVSDTFRRADEAMYVNKRNGKKAGRPG